MKTPKKAFLTSGEADLTASHEDLSAWRSQQQEEAMQADPWPRIETQASLGRVVLESGGDFVEGHQIILDEESSADFPALH